MLLYGIKPSSIFLAGAEIVKEKLVQAILLSNRKNVYFLFNYVKSIPNYPSSK